MKKVIAMLMCLMMMLSVVGCSNNEEPAPKAETPEVKGFVVSSDINVINPWSVGGSADVKLRLTAQFLEEQVGQSVIVTNINGAGGTLAAADFMLKPVDEHNLLMTGIGMFTLTPLVNKDITYTFDDFKPVAEIVSDHFILFANPEESGIDSMESLFEYAENNQVIFGSNPPGGTTHLLQAALFEMAGYDAETVSGSSVENITALLGGHVKVAAAPPSVGADYVKEGTLVPIGVFSENDYDGFEGHTVPSIKKKYGHDIVFNSSNFLCVSSVVSDEVVDYYYQEIMKVYDTEEFKAKAAEMGYIPPRTTPSEIKETVLSTADLFKRLSALVLE